MGKIYSRLTGTQHLLKIHAQQEKDKSEKLVWKKNKRTIGKEKARECLNYPTIFTSSGQDYMHHSVLRKLANDFIKE